MSLSLGGLHPTVKAAAEYALAVARYYGLQPEVTSGYRSVEEQRRLYNNYLRCLREGRFGREPGCMYPANRPGNSAHNYGLAWDSWVPQHQQAAWTTIRRWIGFRVPETDWIHAEVNGWRNFVQ